VPAIDPTRRRLSATLLAGLAGSAFTPAWAQSADTLSLVVPYPAGGGSDLVARTIQPSMAKTLGKTIVVDNVGGVAGSLGAQKMLDTGGAGQAMLIGSQNELVLAPLALKAVRYKGPDFRMVAHLSNSPLVLFARPDFPANTIDELVKLGKAPGAKPFTLANVGKGSLYHLVGEAFADRLGLQVTHIPYRGGAPAMQDLGGGVVDLVFFPLLPTYVQMIEAGRLKAIGTAAEKRSTALPKVPAFSETAALKDFYFDAWSGLFVSAKVDTETAARLGKAANEAVATPEYQKMLALAGASVGPALTLEQAAAFYKRETDRYLDIARKIKLEAE
jgi:tripartite-type tricarboxylate transporter receptor subunit TctC